MPNTEGTCEDVRAAKKLFQQLEFRDLQLLLVLRSQDLLEQLFLINVYENSITPFADLENTAPTLRGAL